MAHPTSRSTPSTTTSSSSRPADRGPMARIEFVHQANPGRVVFGPGSLRHLEREIRELGAERAVVLCSPSRRVVADDVANRLRERAVGVFDRATVHVPIELAREARAFAAERRADAAIAIGGGS